MADEQLRPIQHFKFCPRCAAPAQPSRDSVFHCQVCGFVYYFNPAIAAAAFIVDDAGKALFIRRAKEPAKGKLAIPGGFIDQDETAEAALRREVQEEVNLRLGALEYLSSHCNQYHYKGVTYPVLDLFFIARPERLDAIAALDAVESYCWLDPAQVDPQEIAFPSVRAAVADFIRKRTDRTP